jgi:hypothetical protein
VLYPSGTGHRHSSYKGGAEAAAVEWGDWLLVRARGQWWAALRQKHVCSWGVWFAVRLRGERNEGWPVCVTDTIAAVCSLCVPYMCRPWMLS